MNLNREMIIKLQEAKRYEISYINESGYAGCMPNGNIVDRRFFPEAFPVPANSLLDIPPPKKLPNE